ncbi:hypothetical protein A5717_26090 [Mycolicibacterium porcinum]|uniref:hypothetical protein n=1 Tax=Mycolicibacterium porcinum TaxID=39693 RepID=UPI00080BE0F9|nr:hypothetical protein [Mycolicibacterium porcinum]OCB09248.1 hypothetical protein A5717_26090 [Mycolicibacterium porcinum]
MTDIVDKIDQIFAEDTPARPPLKCPHCQRDWHPEPLTQRVANMWSSHEFDPDYDAAADTSRIVCIGAHYQGPTRPAVSGGRILGYSTADLKAMNAAWNTALPIDPFDPSPWSDIISHTVWKPTLKFESPSPSPLENWFDKMQKLIQALGIDVHLTLWHPGDAAPVQQFPNPHYGHVHWAPGGQIAGWTKTWTHYFDEWTPAQTWTGIELPPELHYRRIDLDACSVHARVQWIDPAERESVARLWPQIRSQALAAERRIPLPPRQPMNVSALAAEIEKHHHPYPKEKPHEGQRIPHRGPSRTRRRMGPRHMAKRRR